MAGIRLNIDGRECFGHDGQTVLDVAKAAGIEIPTLCNDDRVKMYGACGVCVVEMEGSPRLLRACSTMAADNMVIFTNTERVRASRQTALELLLSDHTGDCRPPCVLACPAQTDCQGYAGLIACGEYDEALKLIKDKIPLPASIGRVCPHPCEEACRRQLVEEPVGIAALKQFVGDMDLASGHPYAPKPGHETGKRIAVIGGGPGGLSAAYFLRAAGHGVDVYDAMPHMGGMLRYGIPEYRLPKAVLQQEIDVIAGMGVAMKNNMRIGQDISLDYLRSNYDAVIVAIGAWKSTALRCPGEELEGVLGGIDFLRDVALNNPVFTGRRIAVVGGGNTAMDACRTAVRLGAEAVYNIYRRTKAEMPAETIEIEEAEEEGVVFKNLTNPIELQGENGRVKAVRLQVMELGEPDASGRRAPVPVEGKEELLVVDTVIVAIGQQLAPAGLEDIELTGRGNIAADEETFCTNLAGVFALGDATNKGADIAVTAIGEAKKTAEMVERYLAGEALTYKEPYLVKSEKTAEDFADRKKTPREQLQYRVAGQRKNDFLQVTLPMTAEAAKREGSRCLECGCQDYFECKLVRYANDYAVQPAKYKGLVHRRPMLNPHPFIRRDPDKCILCGLCVRVCDEAVGATALGLVERGFDTIVKPALDMDLRDTDCISCGQCISVCPTGALVEVTGAPKQVPLQERVTASVCAFCGVGCQTSLTAKGDMLLRSLPVAKRGEDALLCVKGRFGFSQLQRTQRLTTPLIKTGRNLEPASLAHAAVFANKHLQALQTQYGPGSVAVAIGERYANEEIAAVMQYAKKVLHTDAVYSFAMQESGLADVLGRDASTCTLDELAGASLIVLVGANLMQNHAVAGMKVRRAVENGAHLMVLGGSDELLDAIADVKLGACDNLLALPAMVKALLNAGYGADLPGRDALMKALARVNPDGATQAAAEEYGKAKKAIIVFEKATLTPDAARLVADMALLARQTGKPRTGIIQLTAGANTQGLANAGVRPGSELRQAIKDGSVKGLFLFGEDITEGALLKKLDFLAVQELCLTETAKLADVVFPASSFAETNGSYTSADGKVQRFTRALVPAASQDNMAQIAALLDQTGAVLQQNCQQCTGTDILAQPSHHLVPPKGKALLTEAVASANVLKSTLQVYMATEGLRVGQ